MTAEVERLSMSAFLARIDQVKDPGHEGFWRVVERVARHADWTTGANARPAVATLAGGKCDPRSVRRHLRLAESVSLLVATRHRPGAPTVYALAWPVGVDPAALPEVLRIARAKMRWTRTPDTQVSAPTPDPQMTGPLQGAGHPGDRPTPDALASGVSGHRGVRQPSVTSHTPAAAAAPAVLHGEPEAAGRLLEDTARAIIGRALSNDETRTLRSVVEAVTPQGGSPERCRAIVVRVAEGMRDGTATRPSGLAKHLIGSMTASEEVEILARFDGARRHASDRADRSERRAQAETDRLRQEHDHVLLVISERGPLPHLLELRDRLGARLGLPPLGLAVASAG